MTRLLLNTSLNSKNEENRETKKQGGKTLAKNSSLKWMASQQYKLLDVTNMVFPKSIKSLNPESEVCCFSVPFLAW